MSGEIILCIDDEPAMLMALQRTLRAPGREILAAESGRKALALLAEREVDAVLCDMRMPDMDGYATLTEVRRKHPTISRIVLSAFSAKETMFKIVVDGTAGLYIQKPWKSAELIAVVNHVMAVRAELKRDDLRKVFSGIDGLPALPGMYRRILAMIVEDRQATDIASALEQEPAYAARVLAVANSAIHGVSIASLEQAVVYLGLNTVKNIILACEMFSEARGRRSGPYGQETLWAHANLCNLAVSALYRRVFQQAIPDDLATAGLLHDIGKCIVLRYFPDACAKIEERMAGAAQEACGAEREILGADHAQLGALLLDWWNLPAALVESCLFHHIPEDERVRQHQWMSLLHVADHLAWRAQGDQNHTAHDGAFACAGLSRDVLEDQELLRLLNPERFTITGLGKSPA